jgi:hypothetical protein
MGCEDRIDVSSPRNRGHYRYVHAQRCSPTFYERFQGGFVRELNVFVGCVLDNKRGCDLVTSLICLAVLTTLADGLAAARIAVACEHSFRTGQLVFFDDEGKPLLK